MKECVLINRNSKAIAHLVIHNSIASNIDTGTRQEIVRWHFPRGTFTPILWRRSCAHVRVYLLQTLRYVLLKATSGPGSPTFSHLRASILGARLHMHGMPLLTDKQQQRRKDRGWPISVAPFYDGVTCRVSARYIRWNVRRNDMHTLETSGMPVRV